jgi:hypothetical protein
MPSPFPGMNPFLEHEDVWSDFHGRFLPVAAEEIGRQVRPAYIVKLDRHVYVHELPDGDRALLGRPDIYLTENRGRPLAASSAAALTAPARAQLVPLTITAHQGFIEIRDALDRSLVTAVELLSPSNKQHGSDRDQYLARRDTYLSSNVHLVGIDLLRGGPRLPLHPPPQGDYCVLVSRAEQRPNVDLWPIRLRDRLPKIPVPLHRPDEFAQLDLQAVLERVYEAAGYADYVYERTPQPPVSAEDQAWATEMLAHSAR